MKQSIVWKKPTALLSAAALLAGGGAAFAATGSTATKAATATTQYSATNDANRTAMRTLHDQEFAKALGIDVAKLQAAEKTAREQVLLKTLDTRVKAGELSQAQADELKAAAANGTLSATLKAQVRTRLSTRLAAGVATGRLTQAQADGMLKTFDAQPADSLDGPGFGFGGGHHGRGGFGRPLSG